MHKIGKNKNIIKSRGIHKLKSCKFCGNLFISDNKKTKIFCSKKCCYKDYYKKNRKIFIENAKKFRNSPFGKKYRKKYFYEYFRSERGKNARKKYLQSPKGKIHKKIQSKKYNSSQRAKKLRKIRDHTIKGKEIKRRADKKYGESIKGKIAEKKYWESDKGKLAKFKYYCRRKEFYPIDMSIEDAEFIKKRDKMRCVYCGIKVFEYPEVPNGHPQQITFDHIIRQGMSNTSNIVLACRCCNNSKGDTDVFEWCKIKGIKVPQKILKLLESQ